MISEMNCGNQHERIFQQPGNTKTALRAALEDAWRKSYQQAVDALRDLSDRIGDDAPSIKDLAKILEDLKP